MPGTRSLRGGGLVDRGHRIGNQIGWIGNQTQTEQGWNCCWVINTRKRNDQSGQAGGRSSWNHLRLKCGIDLRT